MEIRLLNGNELPLAVALASEVYQAQVFPYTRTSLEAEQFRQYVNVDYLWSEACKNRLFLWGVFENGILNGVSAMQSVGHITMLYVKPYCQRRGYGSLLLNVMQNFAASGLYLNRITINVFPFQTVPFFLKRGFAQIPGVPNQNSYLSLQCRLIPQDGNIWMGEPYIPEPPQKKKTSGVTYTTKKISTKTILILVFTVLALLFLIGIGFSIHHIFTDGIGYAAESLKAFLSLWR